MITILLGVSVFLGRMATLGQNRLNRKRGDAEGCVIFDFS